MSESENFLTRWSRRKVEAGREPSVEPASESEAGKVADVAAAVPPPAETNDEGQREGEVDLSKLPSLDSIGAGTDIRAFLQKGVPADLARAALRRVWAADPAIRNFIGIAENQYDFATGSDIPGFGPLIPADDVARMVAQVVKEGVPRPTVLETESEPAPKSETAQEHETPVESVAENIAAESDSDAAVELSQQRVDVALQHEDDDAPSASRSHGGALPR